eukprot:1160546-Pelagomonas_calceolata.AAC.2
MCARVCVHPATCLRIACMRALQHMHVSASCNLRASSACASCNMRICAVSRNLRACLLHVHPAMHACACNLQHGHHGLHALCMQVALKAACAPAWASCAVYASGTQSNLCSSMGFMRCVRKWHSMQRQKVGMLAHCHMACSRPIGRCPPLVRCLRCGNSLPTRNAFACQTSIAKEFRHKWPIAAEKLPEHHSLLRLPDAQNPCTHACMHTRYLLSTCMQGSQHPKNLWDVDAPTWVSLHFLRMTFASLAHVCI